MDDLEEKAAMEKGRQVTADHLANERTLLAWVRTSIGIMAFGFVVVKFSLFVKQLDFVLGTQMQVHHGYSGPIGILLVATGAFSLLFGLLRYRRTKKEIDSRSYVHSAMLLNVLVVAIFLISILLLAYLIETT